MNDQSKPTIRLKPKANARAIRHGFPWAYDNEIVTDRRTRKIAPGAVALLEDDTRSVLGLAAINPNSKIFARILDRDPEVVIDADWFVGKLRHALSMREALFDAPFYRLNTKYTIYSLKSHCLFL